MAILWLVKMISASYPSNIGLFGKESGHSDLHNSNKTISSLDRLFRFCFDVPIRPFNFIEMAFLTLSERGPRELAHFLEQYFFRNDGESLK